MPPLHGPGASGSNSRSPRAGTTAAKQNQFPPYPGLCLQNTLRPGSIPGLGRSPGEGNGNLLQYSRLDNPKDRGVWRATVQGVAEPNTTEMSSHHVLVWTSSGSSCFVLSMPLELSIFFSNLGKLSGIISSNKFSAPSFLSF